VNTAQIITIIISVGAFLIAAYGIFERRLAARRSERLRLTAIAENMTQVRRELIELGEKKQTSGNIIEVINTRLEVLSQQALSLVQQHSLTITSTECREIAINLEQTGYREDAEFVWELARERAKKEGDTQELYVNRGYAYFLFRSERDAEAREILQEALSRHATNNDVQRAAHAETLRTWAVWETQLEGPGAQLVTELNNQLDELGRSFSTPRGKAMFDSAIGGR
jgi:hypothetical protein